MTIPVWEYNSKFYLKINAVKVKETQIENGFKKDVLHLMDLFIFSKNDVQKNCEQITGFSIYGIKNLLNTNIQKIGLSESSLNTITKPFSCFYHTAKLVTIHPVVPKYLVMKIIIAILISIPMNM